jgi:hypothetical protein
MSVCFYGVKQIKKGRRERDLKIICRLLREEWSYSGGRRVMVLNAYTTYATRGVTYTEVLIILSVLWNRNPPYLA